MKKSIVTLAIAASLAAPVAAFADATVYGNLHLSIADLDSNAELDMNSNTSAIGVKGSEDLGDGMKAIYKAEFQLDASDDTGGGNALTQRDIFVGLKGGMGTAKFGIMSSNYKQMGGKVDTLYRTLVEGRGGFMETQSQLHNGRAINRGRSTNTVQYSSPKFSGIQVVANTTLSNATDETTGFGFRWANKNITVFADWIDAPVLATSASANAAESAVKVGAKYSTNAFHVAAQVEDAEDLTGSNYMHLNAGYNIDKNNSIQLTYGTKEVLNNSPADTSSVAVAFNHQLSKMTNVYVAFADKSSDTAALENDAFAVGIKKKF